MAKPRKTRKATANGSEAVTRAITFICQAPPEVQAVCLAGDFNAWNPVEMVRENGNFRRRVKLSRGEHQYRFVVDGKWQNDPAAKAQVPNPFGGTNSVVTV